MDNWTDEAIKNLKWNGDDLAYLENIKMNLVKKQRYEEAGRVREFMKEVSVKLVPPAPPVDER